MVTANQFRTAVFPIFALLTLTWAVGCSTLQSNPQMPLADETDQVQVTDPLVVVELRGGSGEREYLRAPLKESMLVYDALKGSGAIHRFRRMDIVLVRTAPAGEKIRLPVAYNSSTRKVADQNNYALHRGDWLEVTEDTSTTFDRMMSSVLQPFRPVTRGIGE